MVCTNGPNMISLWNYFHNIFLNNFTGVAHADQDLYLFPVREKLFPTTLPTEGDEEVRKAMIQMLTDFARTG